MQYQKKICSDSQIYSILHPFVADWFKKKFGTFSAPQQMGVMPIHNRENTLIFAPTGTGKTLTAFASIINELVFLADLGQLEDKVYCVYISPLKALSRDIKVNLKEPLQAIKEIAKSKRKDLSIRVAVRTGDTTASKKAQMLKKPPHILITTPESFAIVQTSPKFSELLAGVKYLIIDEIHSLASNKRGVHLSLSVERLAARAQFIRIGLSATVAPLETVASYLVGLENGIARPCTVVDAQFIKKMDIKVLCPVENLIQTTHNKLQKKMYELLDDLIQSHTTTLIFTNTRAATERVVHTLKDRFPGNYTEKQGDAETKSLIGAHHGSLSSQHRLRIEKQLKNGELRCIVSSTSLELGIDIGFVDLVVLLGSPKSVARALQRIGRSGHKLHDTAKGRIIVLDRDDLVECAVLLKAAIEKKIDKVKIPENCLDVLAQQIYGMAIERKWDENELFEVITRSYCYRNLKREDFDSILSYLAGEYVSLEDRHVYAKIWRDEGTIGRRGKLARVIYMTNIGTIPSESYITVKLGDEVIGKVEESFVERMKKGDVFVLGGETYEFRYARGMSAFVGTSAGRPPTVPSWFSQMLPLSFELACEIQRFRKLMEQYFDGGADKQKIMKFIDEYLYVDKFGANSIYEYFREQYLFSKIPHEQRIVIEHFRSEGNKYVVFHTLYGRRVNDVISRAVAYAIARQQHRDVEITITDNGFMLGYSGTVQARKALVMLKSGELRKLMEIALEKTEVMKRRFRHCATRSLMILRNYKGREKTVGRQQVGSTLLMSAVKQISPNFPILAETRREILEDLMDIEDAQKIIELIEKKKVDVAESFVDYPSPFSFSLVMQGYSDVFKIEDRAQFLMRMHEQVLAKIKNPELKKEFSYNEIWQMAEESKELELQEMKDELKTLAAHTKFPLFIKEGLFKIIEGEELEQPDIDQVKTIQEELPFELREHVKKYIKKYDLKNILRRQLDIAHRKAKFDADVYFELKAVINGKRKYISRKLREFLDELFSGPVPYAWKTELVKFLMKVREDIRSNAYK